MLLDEPLTSLDVVAAEEMKTQLRHMKDGRVTIFSTHILDLALDLCDSIVLLSHGMLEEIDRTALGDEELKNRIIEALRSEDGRGNGYDIHGEGGRRGNDSRMSGGNRFGEG